MRSVPCRKRRGAQVSWLSLKTKVDGFSRFDLKTGSSGLVIWNLKLPRRFVGLGLKIKQVTVCRLRHKTDGRMIRRGGTRRDLAACFAWKQVTLGFPSLASRLVEARLLVVLVASSWRSRGVEAEDGRVDATGCVGPFYPKIFIFYVLGRRGSIVF